MNLKMNKWKIFLAITIIIIVIAVLIVGLKVWRNSSQKTNFVTAKVSIGRVINTVTATGTIQAIKTVEVGTQVSGVISKIYADYNSHIKKGQLLAELDRRPLLLSLKNAEASFESAKAEMVYQFSTYKRTKVLYEKNLVAQADYDLALYNYSKSQANLKSASYEYSKDSINLDYAYIYSPIDGVVIERAVDEGQTVAASFSTPTLFTIANDLTRMQVAVNIDEADIGQIKKNQKVSFTVDAFPELKFSGEVTEIRLKSVITSNVVTYTIIVKAPNPDNKLMPGMTANIAITVEEADNALTIPRKALRFLPDYSALFTYTNSLNDVEKIYMQSMINSFVKPKDKIHAEVWVKQGKIIRPLSIEVGVEDDSKVNILSGLNEGDEVIISMNNNEGSSETSESAVSSPFMPKPPKK
jgi:HlyD family secretion protein